MRITTNGTEQQVPEGTALTALLPADRRGIAVALNDTVVERHRFDVVELTEGDRVEIVTSVQGG